MSAFVCARCGGPIRIVGVETRHYECVTCGPTDAKAPEIRHRTSMDPGLDDVKSRPASAPRDPAAIDMFGVAND